jgi:glycosyltransferase involved in cell wall biosynthesis
VAHIGLNLIFLVPGETGGMEVAARELLPALLEAASPQMRFTAFINRETVAANDGPWGELLPAVTVPVNASSRPQWVLGEQLLLPRLARRAGVELVHSLASTAPATGAFARVVTVHDLIYARFPEAHGGVRALAMRTLVPLAVRRSDRVIAISQSTRSDLETMMGTPTEKIDVVPQGLGQVRSGGGSPAEQTRRRLDLGERKVLLCLSAKRPHKNLMMLIGALALIPSERRPIVLMPGYPTPHEAQLRERARELGVQREVRMLGWVGGKDLEDLWTVADAFVYPSLYEGFGLPVLEAMARGVPVACADASSLPEVAGRAALLFDPRSAEQIADAITRLIEQPGLVERLRIQGSEQAAKFTWERTAQLTLQSYERTLASKPTTAMASL